LRIIELSIRHFTDAGTFAGATSEMKAVADAGFDVVFLMPVMPIDRTRSRSPYAVTHYRKLNSELGSLQDLEQWLKECRQLGLQVVLDIPLNHTSPAHEWVGRLDFYRLDSQGEMHAPIGTRWSDVVQLNHDSPLVQHELIEVLSFWLKMGFDGFRYDAAAFMPKQLLQGLIESANAMVGERLHHWCDSSELLAEVDGMTAFLDHHSVVSLLEGEPVGHVFEQRHRDGIFYMTNHDSLHQRGSALKQWGERYSVIRDELFLHKGHLIQSFCEWREPSATYSFLD